MGNGDTSQFITFIQRYLPPLEAGEYQISVQQNLLNKKPHGESDRIDESYLNMTKIAVSGERFTIDPKEIESVFPPANNQGDYSNVLPHILLARRTLLWERTPTAAAQGYPWLALLLFTESDPPPTLQTIQVGDLQRQPFVDDPQKHTTRPSTLPADAVSYVDGYANLGLSFAPEYGENYYDRCQAIDVPLALFNTIAPSLADLKWLGSARTVPVENKPGAPEEIPGTFSLVIGNRMPTKNSRCTAHLVSFEGMSGFLPTGDTYLPATIKLPNGMPASQIRLVSLQSWSFASVDPVESFEGFLTGLDAAPLQRQGIFHLEPPPLHSDADANSIVAKAFGLGYTAVNHQTRQGDTTVSWYRGPFVPFEVPPVIFIPPPDSKTNLPAHIIATADQLVRYDPDNGLMDITYAAAWELGRLLALANECFSIALYNWRRAGQRASASAVIREAAFARFGEALALPAAGTRDGSEFQSAIAQFIRIHLKEFLITEEVR